MTHITQIVIIILPVIMKESVLLIITQMGQDLHAVRPTVNELLGIYKNE